MSTAQDYFYTIAAQLQSLLEKNEAFTSSFRGERTDFVRFNQAKIRQAGRVNQQTLSIDLINGRRHASASLTLAGSLELDLPRLRHSLQELRELYAQLPEDPYLLYATDVNSSEAISSQTLPAATEMVEQTLTAAGSQSDLVGIHASGSIYNGFANSFGQRNWQVNESFNLDWSLYLHTDKAVKARYAGFDWSEQQLNTRMQQADEQLSVLKKTPRNLEPGQYRAYLTPMALEEIVDLLGWGGFSLRAHRTANSALLRMIEQNQGLSPQRLNPQFTLRENTAEGVAPNFQSAGFIRPDQITLIDAGRFNEALVSPRSALEYEVPGNGAEAAESPLSYDLAAGDLATGQALAELGSGLYIGNLWYSNYSDLNAARITGMTRFATFWVEQGQIQAPVNVLRFDETIFNLFGDKLIALTQDRELLLDPGTYGSRSNRSARLPGVLVEDMRFTL